MIYVIDNGGSYSDHQIHFVETDRTKAEVEEYLRCRCYDHSVVAVAERFEWFEGGACALGDLGYLADDLPDWVRAEVTSATKAALERRKST